MFRFEALTLLSAVHELASVGALNSRHELLVDLVRASVVEGDLSERSATARVVDDVLHNALDEAVALAEVEDAKLGSALASAGVGSEDRSTTLTLS